MTRIFPLMTVAAAVVISAHRPAIAFEDYRVELSATMGYTFSEGVNIRPFDLEDGDGNVIGILNGLDVKSGFSYGAGIDFLVAPHVMLGFNWSQQRGRLVAQLQRESNRDITDMTIDNYHGVLTFLFPDPWRAATPFFMFGLGGTQYRFSDFHGQSISGDSRFSSTWGLGVKFHGDGALGVRFLGRWTPTYIKSDPGGYWCNYYGCWQSSNPDYSNQFELVASMLARF